MQSSLVMLAALGMVGLVVVILGRMNEIFCVSVRDGRTLLVRGAIPPSLLDALGHVVSRAGLHRGTIRAVRAETHARLVTSGIDEGTTQRLRNVFGHHSVQKLRAAPRGTRNVGQWLGVAWLAWLFVRR